MKHLVLIGALGVTGIVQATAATSLKLIEASAHSRVGFDSNPAGTSGTSAAVLGDDDTLIYAAGAGFALGAGGAGETDARPKLTDAGEAVRFEEWSGENHSTHRFGAGGKFFAGEWTVTGEGSALYVAGSRGTLATEPTVNANAMTLWRERRRQWQQRVNLQAETVRGERVARVGAKVLAMDYHTDVAPGRVAFADRADAQVSADAGWRRNPRSLWLAGVRAGMQVQDTVNAGDAEYSNDYLRLALGWEGTLFGNTTVSVAGGPDFRRYSGDVAAGFERDRTSFWVEACATAKLEETLTLTGKVARTPWLSSTGKTAYMDTCAELSLKKGLGRKVTVQIAAKVHQCDYYPVVRDDWESILGAGVSWKLSGRTTVLLDVARHEAWNEIEAAPERKFDRVTVNLGASVKF